MKLKTTDTKTTRTKTGTITVADLRAKFRIPEGAMLTTMDSGTPLPPTEIVVFVTHVVEAAK